MADWKRSNRRTEVLGTQGEAPEDGFELEPVPDAAGITLPLSTATQSHLGPTFAEALGGGQADYRNEVAQYVEEALSRFAVTGTSHFAGNRLCLASPRGIIEYNANTLLVRWGSLDEPNKRKHAADVARYFAESQRSSSPPPPSGNVKRMDRTLVALAGAVALVLGFVALFHYLDNPFASLGAVRGASTTTTEQTSSQPSAPEAGALTRTQQACEASRGRVYQGATLGVADAEGWVVELAFAKTNSQDSMLNSPALGRYFGAPLSETNAKYLWTDEPRLAAFDSGGTSSVLAQTTLTEPTTDKKHSVLFATFSGGFVDTYLREESRGRFFHLAASMATELGATHAAVYARCAHDSAHAVGSWFRGDSAGGAAASLLYFMGTYGNPVHLALPFYKRPGDDKLDRGFAFFNIRTNLQAIDRTALATLVGTEGGMALGGANEPVVIAFPFADANRAARVSRTIARVSNLAR